MDMRGHNLPPMTGNWIAVSRDIRDHPIVGFGQSVPPADPSRGAYSRNEAWQDLVMEAKYKPFQVQNKGKAVTLQRGQLLGARAWLAKRWNWSEKTVRVFIEKLEHEFMVRSETVQIQGPEQGQSEGQRKGQSKGQRSGHYSNVLTICNYNIYQTVLELMAMSEGQSEGQNKGLNNFEKGPHIKQETKDIPPLIPPEGGEKPVKISRQRGAKIRLAAAWVLPLDWRARTKEKFGIADARIDQEVERFRRYWTSPDAKNPMKADWLATWENWIDRAIERIGGSAKPNSDYNFKGEYKGGLF